MAKCIFDIEDASDGHESEHYGGEVDLQDLRPIGKPRWDLGPPDPNAPLQPIDGGTVEAVRSQRPRVTEPAFRTPEGERRITWAIANSLVTLIPTVVLVVLVFLGFGFVIVVTHDVEQNNLDLAGYVRTVGLILGGLGTAVAALLGYQVRRRKQGDGSG